MPISRGGLGIRAPSKIWPEARISALANFHSHAAGVGVPADLCSTLALDTEVTLMALVDWLGGSHEPTGPWLAQPTRMLSPEATAGKQSWWADQVSQVRRARLPGLGTARDRVRLEA